MSLHKFAEQVASQGRGEDSLLVHMTPDEVQRLQAFAQANGRSLTVNPTTGLPEAGMLSDLFKTIAPIALGAFLGPAGMGLTFGGLSSAVSAGIATGGITALATGSLSRGLMAGLGAYGGAGLGEGLMNAGAGTLAGQSIGAGLTSDMTYNLADAGITDAGIQNLGNVEAANQAIQQQAVTPFDKMSAGAKAVANDPMKFAKDNFKYLGAAAAPIMADMMVPTTTKQPNIQSNDTINQSIYDSYSGTYRRLNPVPAANYGTPAYKPFAGGGIVALAAGGDLTNLYNTFGGKEAYDKLSADYLKATNNNTAGLAAIMAQYDKPTAAVAAAPAAAITGATTGAKDYTNLYAAFGGKEGYDKLRDDYLKINNDPAAFNASVAQFDKFSKFTPPATMTYDYAAANPGSVDWTSDAGKKLAMDNYINNYTKEITTKFKTPAEQALELMYRGTTGGTPTAAYDALGGYAKAKNLAESAGFQATPEWQAEYEKKMGYTVIPRMSTAESQAYSKRLQDEYDAKERLAQDKINAANATGANKVTSSGIVDLKTTTGVTQDTKDNTTVGKNTLATTTASGVTAPKTTTDGTYTGTSGVAPTLNTLFGQGKFVGTGTEMGTGTTGPILDFGGKTAFGLTSPLAAAKTEIADQSAAKNLADKNKLDLYSQWGASNPKATNLEHANFVDKIGLDPAVAARLIGISPDQAQSAYNDAKYNKMSGDSQAAYRYLMGQGAYPTKSGVGEIMRPYSEATLGIPANTNRKYIFNQATGKYNTNPDYVDEYKDPSGGVNYLMSQKEISNYFKINQGQDDATTYAWAIANNLTPTEISQATGVPLSQITPKWRAAAANKAAVTNKDGTIDQAKVDQQIKDSWDESAYLAAHPDVAAELATGKSVSGQPVQYKTGYEHYNMYGKAGGFKPTTKNGVVTTNNTGSSSTQVTEDSSSTGGQAAGGLQGLAMGGMPMYAVGGGLSALGSYSDGGRLLRGPGDGVSDSIPATIGQKQQPARLADGEFVVPARIVSELGNGSTEAGAKKLYAMMDRVQRARGKTTGKNKVAANSRADRYLPV